MFLGIYFYYWGGRNRVGMGNLDFSGIGIYYIIEVGIF